MRTPRIVILVVFLSATLILLSRAVAAAARKTATSRYPSEIKSGKSVWELFYYNTPFTLFPPNAAISLTDDNSTSFAARPAAFGPRLEPTGLSGPLWVGSGFADDNSDVTGELGCSDIPGWNDGNTRTILRQSTTETTSHTDDSNGRSSHTKRSGPLVKPTSKSKSKNRDSDGTDNHLHEGSAGSEARRDATSQTSHADIQSIQEGAEIEGKIVLLMRGGCGFLEKVMWAQRRGAVAVIVGDNQRGGPLIQMFAHGPEVENVTVPSVFTARTTAQLLSALTQPGSFIEDTLDDNGNPVLKVQQGPKSTKNRKPNSSSTVAKPVRQVRSSRVVRRDEEKKPEVKPGHWISRLFSWSTSRRENGERHAAHRGKESENQNSAFAKHGMPGTKGKPKKPSGDNFIIGVQDWRDPDLLDKSKGPTKPTKLEKTSEQSAKSIHEDEDSDNLRPIKPKGGSITPGSGQYKAQKGVQPDEMPKFDSGTSPNMKGHGLISKLFGESEDEDENEEEIQSIQGSDWDHHPVPIINEHTLAPHTGLWVTITPTSSVSPFFDTLLVLVISPLITLSIVYTLLIIRARVRRRRWRAPKSVVERLPVRTYHTVARSPSLSPRLPSPSSTSPTTPLLQSSPTPPRPRSRTTTGIPESESLLQAGSSIATQSNPRNDRRAGPERGAGGFSAEWRKYMGRQVECVVCLEEYVDGVSRVMRLPCGHEFHADCITPWLTTRRRTCPICKGDVVRSLARGSWIGLRPDALRDDGDNTPASSSSPGQSSENSDVEQGIAGPSNARDQRQQDNWLGIISNSFGGRRTTATSSPSQSQSQSRPLSRTQSRSQSPSPNPQNG